MTHIEGGERRFELGRVVSQTFGLIGRNFFTFVALAVLLIALPRFAITAGQALLVADRPELAGPAGFGGAVLILVTSYILQGSLTRASMDDLSSRGVNVGAALGDGLRYFFPLFLVALLVGLGVFVGLLFLIVPGVFLMVRWAVAAPAVVAEREGPTHSIGRSADLTAGHRWAVFGLVLLYAVFAYALAIGLAIVLSALGPLGVNARGPTTRNVAAYIEIGVSAMVAAFTSLVCATGSASLYFELRRVKDGVGIDELAKVFE